MLLAFDAVDVEPDVVPALARAEAGRRVREGRRPGRSAVDRLHHRAVSRFVGGDGRDRRADLVDGEAGVVAGGVGEGPSEGGAGRRRLGGGRGVGRPVDAGIGCRPPVVGGDEQVVAAPRLQDDVGDGGQAARAGAADEGEGGRGGLRVRTEVEPERPARAAAAEPLAVGTTASAVVPDEDPAVVGRVDDDLRDRRIEEGVAVADGRAGAGDPGLEGAGNGRRRGVGVRDPVEADPPEAVEREVGLAGADEDGRGRHRVDGDGADRERLRRVHQRRPGRAAVGGPVEPPCAVPT